MDHFVQVWIMSELEVSDTNEVSQIGQNDHNGCRHAMPQVHTQGNGSHALQEASQTPPTLSGPHFKVTKTTQNIKQLVDTLNRPPLKITFFFCFTFFVLHFYHPAS